MKFIKTREFSWISVNFTAVAYSVCFAVFLAFPFEKYVILLTSQNIGKEM